MKAKILSAKKTNTFPWKEREIQNYEVVVESGKIYQYADFDGVDITTKIGQEVEFTEVPPKDPKYNPGMRLAKDGYQGSGKKPYGKSPEEAIVGAKCMVLSYCKDLVVACTGTEVLSVEQASESLISAFRKVWVAIGIENDMKAKITPIPASTGAISGQEPHSTLKASIITILQAKMKKNNYRSKDMIDVAAAEGIELKYDASSDGIIWIISEDEANKLINLLG